MYRTIRMIFVVTFGVSLLLGAESVLSLDPCNGSVPDSQNYLCGTETKCVNGTPGSLPVVCSGTGIFRSYIAYKCTGGAGTGSTLCGGDTTATPLVCTTIGACSPKTTVVNGQTLYYCGPNVTYANSYKPPPVFKQCLDTTMD